MMMEERKGSRDAIISIQNSIVSVFLELIQWIIIHQCTPGFL
jgi:hypothetical protein